MKKYFAWVFFMVAAISVPNLAYKYATGSAPVISPALDNLSPENILVAIFSLFLLGFFALCLFLWWRWK